MHNILHPNASFALEINVNRQSLTFGLDGQMLWTRSSLYCIGTLAAKMDR